MNAPRDPDRLIHAFLMAGEEMLPDPIYDEVRAVIEHKRQRTFIGPWRTPTMNRSVTYALGAVAVVVIGLLLGYQLLGEPTGFGGPSEPSATLEPTATPQPTATPEPAGGLPEGPHLPGQTDQGALAITITIAGHDWDGTPGEGYIQWGPTGAEGPTGAGVIGYTEGEYYVYGDPCAWSSTRPDTPATTVDELMAALANQASREATAPEDITVAGYAGKKLILHMADEVADFDACDEADGEPGFGLFGVASEDGPARGSQDAGQIEEVLAVDVDGELVIIIGLYYPGTPQNTVDEVRAILASATFELP